MVNFPFLARYVCATQSPVKNVNILCPTAMLAVAAEGLAHGAVADRPGTTLNALAASRG